MGASFLRAMPELPFDEWSGPIRSGRGWHLIRMTGVQEPGPLPDWELQARLLDDWHRSQWMTARQDALRDFARRYDIRLPEIEQLLRQTALAEPAQ
jgi:parvulin-like peptidyl-prolyl isomerase